MFSNYKKSTIKNKSVLIIIFTIILTIGFIELNPTEIKGISQNLKQKSNILNSQLLIESMQTFQDFAEQTASKWAESLKERNGALRYSLLSDTLKMQQYIKFKELNWVIGVSSPWVVSYKVNKKSKINDKTYQYQINYILTDSTGHRYLGQENIIIKKSGLKWHVIKSDNYTGTPNIIRKISI
jgi:bla regulator protein BlaR1